MAMNNNGELHLPCRSNQGKHIEPNDNDLELNAVAYAFSKIFQPEIC